MRESVDFRRAATAPGLRISPNVVCQPHQRVAECLLGFSPCELLKNGACPSTNVESGSTKAASRTRIDSPRFDGRSPVDFSSHPGSSGHLPDGGPGVARGAQPRQGKHQRKIVPVLQFMVALFCEEQVSVGVAPKTKTPFLTRSIERVVLDCVGFMSTPI